MAVFSLGALSYLSQSSLAPRIPRNKQPMGSGSDLEPTLPKEKNPIASQGAKAASARQAIRELWQAL